MRGLSALSALGRVILTGSWCGSYTVGFPNDPKLRGLAAVTYHMEKPPWEFDIVAVPPGEECVEISDWHRRHGRANTKGGNTAAAAEAGIDPLPTRDEPGHE